MIYFILGIGLVAWFYYAKRDRFRLNTWLFNYEVDDTLDMLLNSCLDSGIRSVTITRFYMLVVFQNGKEAELWNSGKYYAWISRGHIGLYHWDCCRPSTRTMVRLKEEIKRYYVG